ncbi:MAG: hypothetical protein KDB07_00910, partial [Planctomycetes bacterium]|nr:hypothetical protein [Planctomycetota bacterium]
MSEGPNINEGAIVNFVLDSTKERYQRLSWQGSFVEYLGRVAEDPYKHTRTAYQLMRDMLYHFGVRSHEDNGEKIQAFKLFDDPFGSGSERIFGLERSIKQIVNYIDAGAREQSKERILILHGPVGTAKTSIGDMIARGLEAYTAAPEGEVYTFSWRFGKDFNGQGGGAIGFGGSSKADYAGLHNPVAVLPSQLHEHPLLLIPKEERSQLLEKMFKSKGLSDEFVIPHKLIDGELEYNSKQIYNYLIRLYEGNWLKVMDHVLVQRVQFSESAGIGIAKIPPQSNAESASQAVSIDENFRFISNLLTSVNLVRYFGKYVHGNRGLVHYSDIFKKPSAYLQHLLGAVEEHRMDFGEVGNHIDCCIIGTTNIHEYLALRQDPISKALRSRMRKLDVPYLRNYRDEEKIYRRGLRPFRKKLKIAPHTTELASKWAVMTRVEPSELHQSEELDAETRELLANLTPSTKAMIYAGMVPPHFSNKDRQKLTQRTRRMLFNEIKYEGMNGVATRTLQNLIADMCEETKADCITPFRVFDLLEELVEQGPENHDFLAREAEGQWFDFLGFVTVLRREYDEILASEIGNSIVDIDEAEME